MQYPRKSEEGSISPETGFTDSCETLPRCWELNLVLWKIGHCFLTPEPSLQTKDLPFYFYAYERLPAYMDMHCAYAWYS